MKRLNSHPSSLLTVLLMAAALVTALGLGACSRSGVDSLTGPAHNGAVAFAKGPGQAGTPPPPPPPPPGPVAADPCVSVSGFGATVANVAAEVPQNRVGRLRIEITGDVASGALLKLGNCSTNATPTTTFISGRATASSGGGLSVSDTFGAIAQVPGEPGVLVATAANGDVLEMIWPGLAGDVAGPPILRFQLARQGEAGRALTVSMSFVARSANGATATFTASAANLVIPALK